MNGSSGSVSTAIADRIDDLCATLAEDDRAVLAEVAAALVSPLRVAVAGRVNAGKSTMVNALLGQRCAPTDVSECTRFVTWYSHGEDEHLEVHLRDGEVVSLPLGVDGALPADLGIPSERIDHLEVTLPHELLVGLTLIDTPGLSTLDEERMGATRELLALDLRSRSAIAKADVLVLVAAMGVQEDDVGVVSGYTAQFRGLDPSAVNTLAVLTKIDLLTDDPDDALGRAWNLAGTVAGELRLAVAEVVPVNTLMAETVECGVLDNSDLDALRNLADLPDDEFAALTRSTQRFLERDAPVSGDARARLLAHLDLFGVAHARQCLRGGMEVARLTTELREQSGIAELRRRLVDGHAADADRLKAVWGLAALHRGAYGDSELSPFARATVRDLLEDLELDAELMRLALHRALSGCATGRVQLTDDEADEVRHLALAADLTEALRPSAEADGPGSPRDAAAEAAQRWRRKVNSARLDPATREAGEQVLRLYERMFVTLEGS